jgi:hypothetical protein
MGTDPSRGEKRLRFRSSAPRIPIRELAQLVDPDGGACEVVLIDISSEGFRLRSGGALVIGQQAVLRVHRYGDYPVEIVWTRGLEAGGVFLEHGPEIA